MDVCLEGRVQSNEGKVVEFMEMDPDGNYLVLVYFHEITLVVEDSSFSYLTLQKIPLAAGDSVRLYFNLSGNKSYVGAAVGLKEDNLYNLSKKYLNYFETQQIVSRLLDHSLSPRENNQLAARLSLAKLCPFKAAKLSLGEEIETYDCY